MIVAMRRKSPRKANGLLDDRAVAQRILDHIRNRTTDMGEAVWREPTGNYSSEKRFAAEREFLRRATTPFCPSAALPENGSYVAREAAGVPVLAVRGEDGKVRAFRNACRHRGMQVAQGSGCAKSFVCGYHGWTYRLDGSLRHIPHEEGFPGLDKERHGLVPIRAEERHGLVFVTQEGKGTRDETLEKVPALIDAEQTLFSCNESVVEANWKILLEGFIEGYHIRATHKDTFFPYGFDNLNVVETFGRHSRITYPFRRIEKLAAVPPAERRVDGLLTYVYQLFPNVLITALSRHTNVVILEPLTPASTRQISYGLTNRGLSDEASRKEVERDAQFVTQTGAAEDRAVVAAIQRGLAAGANSHFTFGRFEGAIVHFHRTLRAAL
jgi:phenylpropionate dioxygenase-like ring-hydroxylating dioxygenase large terminal subunit